MVDNFLRVQNLAPRAILIDIPRPNVAAPSSLSSEGRETFRTYLDSAPNKAFAVGDSRLGWATGRRTPEDARQAALTYCAGSAGAPCRVVNVNNRPTE
jgi:hypothetical protein